MNLQENFFDTYQQLTENLTIAIECLPLCFYYDYEKIKYYENSKRVLLPKYILHQLSKYENIEFPINIKVTNEKHSISKYVTVLEFIPDIEHMYLSNNMFHSLQLSETEVVSFEILKDALPTATSIKIKPHTNNFALIENKKSYLEANFKNLFGIIEKGDSITTPYLSEKITIDIIDCQPEEVVSMIEIEELEVDIDTSYEFDHIQKLKEEEERKERERKELEARLLEEQRLQDERDRLAQNQIQPQSGFKSFSGQGRKLGGS